MFLEFFVAVFAGEGPPARQTLAQRVSAGFPNPTASSPGGNFPLVNA
jgi:hypothetical protein